MTDIFDRFIKAERQEIMRSMDEECRKDPIRFRQWTLSWVEENAESFRQKWNRQNATKNQDNGSTSCNGMN
ncbi:MAG: hypothetical protein ACOCW2_03695 [Chitinivibrionales bacterium]